MISFFRSKVGNVVMLGILLIGLIAIVVTGFGTGGMGGLSGITGGGGSSGTVAEVGDRDLTESEVASLIDARYRQAVRQQPTLDRATFIDQVFAPLLDRIIGDNALVQFGRSAGLVASQSMVDRLIVQIPAFQNAAGQFDNNIYQSALAQQRITERQLREDIANGEIIRMVLGPVGGQVRVPNAVATQYASLLLEQRRGGLGAVPVDAIARTLNPSDQEITAFYQANRQAFQVPERRVVRYALIGREQLGDAVRATDQEVQAYYQQNQAQYGPSETRNLQKIVLPDEAAARAFVQRVQGGTSFLEAAQQAGFAAADVNFANQTRQQFAATSTEEVANAAFGAQQGAVVGPLRTPLGFQVVRVEAINRSAGRPLEAVRGEIVQAIEQRKFRDQLQAVAERVQQRLDDGASFEEVAQQERLQIQQTPPLTAVGAAPGTNFQFPPNLAPVLRAAFEMEPDDDPVLEVVQPEQLDALVAVGQQVPPTVPPLAEVRDQVRARLIQQTALQRARQIAEQIVARINGGMATAQAYAQSGLSLPPPREMTLRRLQIAQQGQQVPPPLRVLFSIPQGRARMIPAPGGAGWIIVHHIQRTPGNVAADPNGRQLVNTVRQGFGDSASAEIQEQFGRAVQGLVDVERNEELINAMRQRLRSGSAAPQ